jgi:hypothetical protein
MISPSAHCLLPVNSSGCDSAETSNAKRDFSASIPYSVSEQDVLRGYQDFEQNCSRIASQWGSLSFDSRSTGGLSSNLQEAALHALTGSGGVSLRSTYANSSTRTQLRQKAEVHNASAWHFDIHAIKGSAQWPSRFKIRIAAKHQRAVSTVYRSSGWLELGRLPSESNNPSTPEALAAFFCEQNVEFKRYMSELKTEQANKSFINALYERVYDRWRKWISDYKAWRPEARAVALKNRNERRRGRKALTRTRDTDSSILPADSCLSHTADAGEESTIVTELRRST